MFLSAGWEKLVAGSIVVVVAIGLLAVATVVAGAEWASGRLVAPVEGGNEQPDLPLPAAADGGLVRIVESGFSRVSDVAGKPMVSWGLVVENTSDRTAAVVDVSLDIVDAAGESLVTEVSQHAKERTITLVMPGSRAGIGDYTYVTGPDAAEVTFTLDEPGWWPVGHPGWVAALTASRVEPFREQGGEVVPYLGEDGIAFHEAGEGALIIQFRVDSECPYILDLPRAQAIFRDGAGRIVGGTPPGDTDPWATFPPGWSIQHIRVRDVPEQADLSRTEVYPYPFHG